MQVVIAVRRKSDNWKKAERCCDCMTVLEGLDSLKREQSNCKDERLAATRDKPPKVWGEAAERGASETKTTAARVLIQHSTAQYRNIHHPVPEKISAELCRLLHQITRRERVSTSGLSWNLFACHVHFFCREPQLSCFPGTKGTNNHVKQSDACFFASNPIGVTYNQLAAMLTILFHKFSPDSHDLRKKNIPYQI